MTALSASATAPGALTTALLASATAPGTLTTSLSESVCEGGNLKHEGCRAEWAAGEDETGVVSADGFHPSERDR